MPINISEGGNSEKKIAWLCDNDWDMPTQILALEEWLRDNAGKLDRGNYYADIGYSPREGAACGGVALSIDSMKRMVDIGIELHLSEYPPFVDEED